MNEFVAAQDPADPGVLLLSPFAGAAAESRDAVLTNPWHPDDALLLAEQAVAILPDLIGRVIQGKNMTIIDTEMLWRQFGAALDSLENALRECPDALWEAQLWADQPDQWVAAGFSSFWYLGYHALFWLDLYLTGAEEGFAPPQPFDLVEMEDGESLPRPYLRDELLGYAELCRRRSRQVIGAMTEEEARRICRFPWGEIPFAELQMYSMRHMMEHAAQLSLFLGQQAGKSTRWVPQAQ